MGQEVVKRRVYSREFKAEIVALIKKREKPVTQIAVDLGINETMLYRWVQETHESVNNGLRAFPGHGRPRDEELARLRKENKALRNANKILRKAAAIFAREVPR